MQLVLTLRIIHFLAMSCIYVFLHILESNSDYFHIHHSPIGLSDGNTVSSAGYELWVYMYMYSPISFRNKVLLYVVLLFAGFLVWGLGKVSLAQVLSKYLGVSPLSII